MRGGTQGVVLRLRLPGYRSLPLSCVREIAVSIDGVEADLNDASLVLNGYGLPLRELSERTDVWWWILDPGELFFVPPKTLEPGVHEVTASMSTLVPYSTGGRTTKTESDARRLSFDPAV